MDSVTYVRQVLAGPMGCKRKFTLMIPCRDADGPLRNDAQYLVEIRSDDTMIVKEWMTSQQIVDITHREHLTVDDVKEL